MEEKQYKANLNERELTMLCNLLHQKNKGTNDEDYRELERKLTELYYTK